MAAIVDIALVVAALVAAAPLGAEPFGQGFVVEVEPNGTAGTATPLGGTDLVAEGQIVGGSESDFWSFAAVTGDRVYVAVVTAATATQTSNSQLDLIAPDGTVLETDLDDGTLTGHSSSLAGTAIPDDGTYYLRVKSQSPGGSTEIRPYRLYLRVQTGEPAAEAEPNDSEPQPLPIAGWVAGNLDLGELDLYSLALSAGDTVFASLDADPERDGGATYDLRLGVGEFGAGATMLLVDDSNTTSPSSEAIVVTVAEPGTFRILVDQSGGLGGADATYHLSVSVLPAALQGAACATYASTDVPQTIAEGPGRTTSTLTVPGNPRIADLDLILALDHAQADDLDVHLVAPAGNAVGVVTDVGSADSTDWDAVFDDESAAPAGAYSPAVLAGVGLQPEPSYRLDWFDGEDAGGEWTLVIDDDTAGNGGTLAGWSLRICTPPALPACPEGYVRADILATDFESGADGFTHAGTQDEWELGLPSFAPVESCASGSSCWDTDLDGSYNASGDQTLVSPAVDLAGTVGPVVVSWAQKYQLENATFDRYDVTLAVAGGGATESLFDWRGADMSTDIGVTTLQESAGWGVVERAVDTGFDGTAVELRFRLRSDFAVQFDGVAIDDVTISACVLGPDIFADGFDEAGDVCAWSGAVGAPPCDP